MSEASKRVRIGYCVWLESLSEDVVKGQVLDVLEGIAARDDNFEIVVIAFTRLNDYLAHRERWRDVRRDIGRRGLRLVVLPHVLFPGRFELFFAKWHLLPVVAFFAFPALFLAARLLKLRILHLRSYPLIPSAILLKKILPDRRIVLDTRSPFPEESVSSGKWKPASLTFRLWKRIEAAAVANFDTTVCVTRAHADTLPQRDGPKPIHVIPNNAAGPNRSAEARAADYARRLATHAESFCFAYVGSLSRKGVSRPEVYGEVVILLRKLEFKHHFLFVTRETELLRNTFDRLGIAQNEYTMKACDPADVPDLLASAHAGLNFLNKPDLRMSVKTAEYLASGLPFICNDNVLGAQEIVRDFAVGISTTLASVEANAGKLARNYKEFLDRARDMDKYFSTDRVAAEYHKLYSKLLDAA
jgi:glycosyltransferase involved in cell wall biosynthesis